MPLTLLLPTDPSEIYESIDEYDELQVGQIIDAEDDLRLEVLAYFKYAPIVLGDDCEVAMAIVHPIGEQVPPRKEWYCWQWEELTRSACYHILMHKGEVLRLEPSDSPPVIGKAFFQYCTNHLVDEPPKLDRASLAKFLAAAHKRTTGLERYSYKKYVNPDAPFRSIYLVELEPSKALSAA
ncbi:MAG: hypothetical protein ACAF41_34295 (plasmid) [Leptolyngbya sp. BL-A-14]